MNDAAPLAEPLVRDLLAPGNLPGPPGDVEFRFTHGSFVFLTADEVFKVKRARDYGFFDYTTITARQHYCEQEILLNRRGAPDVYLDVLPVYRDGRGHSLTRAGEIVDYAVHMRRLPDAANAEARLQDGGLGQREIRAIARRTAEYYRAAAVLPPDADAMQTNIEENFEQAAAFQPELIEPADLTEIAALQRAWFRRHEQLLRQRACRDGHGDLRLEHVYFTDHGVVLIDCIEFLARFRIADPALDIAFLAMDLQRFGQPNLAERLLGHFAYESDDYDFYPLIDGYQGYRAFVRAKVAGFVANDASTPADVTARKAGEARSLFMLSRTLLRRPLAARVIAVGGVVATGKSTVANGLAARLAAPVVSADATRKSLAGLRHDQRAPAECYQPEFSARVYDEVLRRAATVLASGRTVVIDTTFSQRALRRRVEELAQHHGADRWFVECRAAEDELRRRLRARVGGVSDAREDQLGPSLARFEAVTEWPPGRHVIVDTSADAEQQQRRLAVITEQPTTP